MNLLLTFLASGLWHGANWTYVIWGGLHGIVQVIEKMLDRVLSKFRNKNVILRCISVIVVFIICNFAWVFLGQIL